MKDRLWQKRIDEIVIPFVYIMGILTLSVCLSCSSPTVNDGVNQIMIVKSGYSCLYTTGKILGDVRVETFVYVDPTGFIGNGTQKNGAWTVKVMNDSTKQAQRLYVLEKLNKLKK